MKSMSFVTCGDTVKVFSLNDGDIRCSDLSLQHKDSTCIFNSASWSKDGKWLSCTRPTDTMVIKFKDGQLRSGNRINIENITASTFFNRTNRNVLVGTRTGELLIWDNLDCKVSHKINNKHSGAIEYLAINSEDNYIASVNQYSVEINLLGIKTNKHISTLQLVNSNEISSLRFSAIKKGFLGASSLESVVCVWDIIKAVNIFKHEKIHSGACSDISFSPVSDALLASVSYDKTMKLFDFRNGKMVMSVSAPAGLKCVDIISDGKQIVLGSLYGSVYGYDLRNLKNPLFNFEAYKSCVNFLQGKPNKLPTNFSEYEIGTPDGTKLENTVHQLDISFLELIEQSPVVVKSKQEEEEEEENVETYFNLSNTNHMLYTVRKSGLADLDPCVTPVSIRQEEEGKKYPPDSFLDMILSPEISKSKVQSIEETYTDASSTNTNLKPNLRKSNESARCGDLRRSVLENSINVKRGNSECNIDGSSTPILPGNIAQLSMFLAKSSEGENKGSSTPIVQENVQFSPILAHMSPQAGDGIHNNNVSELKCLITELNETIGEVKQMIEYQCNSLRDLIVHDIRRNILNMLYCSKMDHINLKYQIQNLHQEVNTKFANLETKILDEINKLRQEL